MVVDDDAVFASSLQAIAVRRGYAPVVVGDPDEAVRRFHERPPSAVVLDVTPGGRGLDTLDRFRRLGHDVPVLAVSGPGAPGAVVQVMRSGADDFLCKPVEERQLESALARLLDECRARTELRALRAAIVRDLEDVVRRLVGLGESPVVEAATPPAGSPGSAPAPASLKEIARAAAREAERVAISRMLQRTRWNRKEAAVCLGISYKALLYKIKENGLDKPSTP
jgi:DNA-binding NtrC family response regulator